jgi:excisionase family DNA binding protein
MNAENDKSAHVPLGRRLFDVQAAVAYLRELGADGATKNFVRALISSGALPHLRMGKKHYVSRESLDRWISNHERRR